jgi:hypothetical protein
MTTPMIRVRCAMQMWPLARPEVVPVPSSFPFTYGN